MIVKTLEETQALGRYLGSLLEGGDVLALVGDLGAGKTTLTKALGQGLGVKEEMTSPTFTLIQEYEGRVPVYHFDTYRMEDPLEFLDIGGEDYLYSEGVSIIEWADLISDFLPQDHLRLEVYRESDTGRRLEVRAFGPRSSYLKEAIEDFENTSL